MGEETIEVQVNPLDIDDVADVLRKVYHDILLSKNERKYLQSVIEFNYRGSWRKFYNEEVSDLNKKS